MSNTPYTHRSVYLIIVIILSASCKKLVNVDYPIGQLGSVTVFNNDASAVSAISGLYSSMSSNNTSFAGYGTTVFGGLSADELHNASSATYDDFFNNSLTASTSALEINIWTPAYNYIYQANAILEAIDNSESLSEATRKQVKGEALFLRAFCYFHLVNFFGDVPLVLFSDYKANALLPSSSSSAIYGQMISDLKEAQQLLTSTYPSNNRGRVNGPVTTALLARVYLYSKEWKSAEVQASSVISNSAYTLHANLDSVFLSSSKEAVWQLIPVPATSNTPEGTAFIPGNNTVPVYELTPSLLKSFTPDDKRKKNWTKNVTVSGNTFTYPFKYKVRTAASAPVSEYYVMMRLAEQYLIRAEARAIENNISGSIQDIDRIRKRAGLPLLSVITPNISQPALLDSIAMERKREFFSERGHRWMDLKRTGKADAVLAPLKTDWQSTDVLYPIPKSQILINTNLKQNPGYN